MFTGLDDENKRGLKHVLENKKILKLIHDVRNDWDSLLHQYFVRIYNFIDTQEGHFILKLFYYQEVIRPISLFNFIETHTKFKLSHKEKFKKEMMENQNFWLERPLNEDKLIYASQDVMYLFKAWNSIEYIFNDNLREIVFLLI
jgi:exonuclease 3'-5' domain-containing protein 1